MKSKEYYALWDKEKKQVTKYKGRINELKAIIDNLNWSFDDEVRDSNNYISGLYTDIGEAIKNGASISVLKENVQAQKNFYPESDTKLSNVYVEINNEINRLTRKKLNAEANRDYYKKEYTVALSEEMAGKLL